MFTLLEERRARGEGEQLRQVNAEGVADLDGAVGAVDRDVDVEAERVVPPDDVAEQLVPHPVVRRVDDALLLPRAPRVRAGRAESEAEPVRELLQLGAALRDQGGHVGEGLAAACSDLDLRRDQLTDEVRLELGALGGGLQLLEAVRQREALRVEDRELLLDRNREVGRRLEVLAAEPQLFVATQDALLGHGERLVKRLEQPPRDARPAPALDDRAPRCFLESRSLVRLEG